MKKFSVVEVPHPVLRQKASPVPVVDDDVRDILSGMLAAMYQSNGVGLAGNQVGLLKRLVVIDCRDENDNPRPLKLVNPEIIFRSPETKCHNEGCLSLPREYADVVRPSVVHVRYLDENGNEQVVQADGLLAVALQHEIDHLDGILFIDYLSPFKRKRLLQQLEKRRKKAQGGKE